MNALNFKMKTLNCEQVTTEIIYCFCHKDKLESADSDTSCLVLQTKARISKVVVNLNIDKNTPSF